MNLKLVYRYILSVSINENMFYEKTKPIKNQKRRRKKKLHSARADPPTSDVEGLPIIYCVTTTNIKDLIC